MLLLADIKDYVFASRELKDNRVEFFYFRIVRNADNASYSAYLCKSYAHARGESDELALFHGEKISKDSGVFDTFEEAVFFCHGYSTAANGSFQFDAATDAYEPLTSLFPMSYIDQYYMGY